MDLLEQLWSQEIMF